MFGNQFCYYEPKFVRIKPLSIKEVKYMGQKDGELLFCGYICSAIVSSICIS